MKLLIIADAFPPMRTSAAVHMHELSIELMEQSHNVSVIIPSSNSKKPFSIENFNGIRLISILTPKTKDVSYVRRVIAEFISPYVIYWRLKSSVIFDEAFDGIIWYSPTIFFGPLIARLKKKYQCSAYLVLRDMFPDWAVDLGLMKKGLAYRLLKLVECYQYKTADRIGIQAPGNIKFFNAYPLKNYKSKVEVLWTWITLAKTGKGCSIDLKNTHLYGRSIFVYTGNMGVAQDFDFILNLALLNKSNEDLGFVLVGRGSEVNRLKSIVKENDINNVLFFDEINPDEIPSLYAQCTVGIVALDPRHKSTNIPGKFLSYMSSGLPVLARLNSENDLIDLIEDNKVGIGYVGANADEFSKKAQDLMHMLNIDPLFRDRCMNLANTLFSTREAVLQIIEAIKREG